MTTARGPAIWLPGAGVSHIRFFFAEGPSVPSQWSTVGMMAYWFVYMLSMYWLNQTTKYVPEPYLDEIFHIPQAQLYFQGRFDYWDPKLTTPPGLYIFATLFSKLGFNRCGVFELRLFNATILPVTMLFALSCRHRLQCQSKATFTSVDALHTSVNIALFPPLFFFSGLFYTDLLSTCTVLATYLLFLQGGKVKSLIVPFGLVSLSMRQTNIFWVAIFLGGLEVVRTVASQPVVKKEDQIIPTALKERVRFEIEKWGRGNIHDVTLEKAGVFDYMLCILSIAVAALHRPVQVVLKLSPYIALLVSFGAFVFWNGGVVLGDKSNHVATIHLPQLLYLFAFTAFFSLPLLVTPTINFLTSLFKLLQLPIFPRLQWQYLLVTTYCAGALGVTLLIIHYNTIIHPFTLADNRHYVFYVFRYSILRYPIIRYLLAPIYLTCGWAAYLTLCTPPASAVEASTDVKKGDQKSKPSKYMKASKIDSDTEKSPTGPKTSFVIIFILTTALSLITAPLVEPRYFIIPWVIWRLHVPSLPAQPTSRPASTPSSPAPPSTVEWLKDCTYRNHDYRLWLETLYFLVINVVTGYIFLYKGFAWPQEPGKVQRFMW